MNMTETRRMLVGIAEDMVNGAKMLVDAQAVINQHLANENRELHELISKAQAENARLQMEVLNLRLENVVLDETICDLITPRR